MSCTIDNITVRYSCDYLLDICPYLLLAHRPLYNTLHANDNYQSIIILQES